MKTKPEVRCTRLPNILRFSDSQISKIHIFQKSFHIFLDSLKGFAPCRRPLICCMHAFWYLDVGCWLAGFLDALQGWESVR